MSIFPKRTTAGSYVTIHWNLNAAFLTDNHLFPFVKIGVIDPVGKLTMLFEQHVPMLPSIGSPLPEEIINENKLVYLSKNVPLLLLADYLSGKQKREKLIEILKNIHSGRHYYFTYTVDPGALPGKYSLLSEIHLEGTVTYSGTASEDFFYVESVSVEIPASQDPSSQIAVIKNHSSEPVPVKIISYQPGETIVPSGINVFEIKPDESIPIPVMPEKKYLCYNEERIIIPLHQPGATRCIRNQQWLSLNKNIESEEVIYIMHKELDISYQLRGTTRNIWLKADGLATREDILHAESREAYEEMITNGLIIEIRY